MDFDLMSFLGKQIDELMEPVLEQNADWYKLMYELIQFANNLRFRMAINQDNVAEVVTAALLIKATNTFQSVILLSRKGLAADCGTLTRSLMETVIPLKLIAQEQGFAWDFVRYEKRKRQKLINVILKDSDTFGEIANQVSEGIRDSLKKEIEEEDIPELKIEDLAKKAGMTTFYQLAYRQLSEDAHTTIWSLNRYLNIDQEGNVTELDNGPQIFGATDFRTAAYCILIALDSVNEIFKLESDSELKGFETRLLAIHL
jgi:hypothetical protein